MLFVQSAKLQKIVSTRPIFIKLSKMSSSIVARNISFYLTFQQFLSVMVMF